MTFEQPMTRRSILSVAGASAAGGLIALPTTALSQAAAWPSRPVRLVVPFAAGGPADTLARFISIRLSREFGQPVVIDNKAGAGGTLGAADVAKSTDGHSLLFSSTGALTVVPAVSTSMTYNPDTDLSAVGQAVVTPQVIVVASNSKITNLRELVAAAKAAPGKLNFASAGSGTTTQLGAELLKREANVFMTHIPYRGAAPAIVDVMAGNADFLVADVPAVMSFIAGNRLRALAIAAPKRSEALPQVPTTAEAGLPNVLSSTWYGVMAPSKTPAAVIARANEALNRVLQQPDSLAFFKEQGVTPVGGTPQDFARFIQSESAKWGSLAKRAGVTMN
ncbi:Bug family tripartite tricarboxylate transporter substrate binding protein [Ottowia thiooxydans]|uniref:Tripartite-type tricarboxylate transporter receptor subunit TctC n=1 Tax=Ottowia thiooxydans TaxID=219182 RepID=A0ABV2Q526_9BURK